MDYILREIVKNNPDTHISDELLQVADYMEELQRRLADAEERNTELEIKESMYDEHIDAVKECLTLNKRLAEAEKKISEWEAAPDWIKAGDGTLHGAIDYWQERASKAEQRLVDLEEELETLDREMFVLVSDVLFSKNEKTPNWLVDKAKAIYCRPRL